MVAVLYQTRYILRGSPSFFKNTLSDYRRLEPVKTYCAIFAREQFAAFTNEASNISHQLVTITRYSDADFVADKIDRNLITGGWITVDGIPVSWLAKKQGGVSLLTMEAEFTAASVVVTQMLGLRELLGEIGVKCRHPMVKFT